MANSPGPRPKREGRAVCFCLMRGVTLMCADGWYVCAGEVMSREGARDLAAQRCDWGDRKAVDWYSEAKISSSIGVMLMLF